MSRIKNPYFWFGMISAIGLQLDITAVDITSWDILFVTLRNVAMNPYNLAMTIMVIVAIWNNPTTEGLGD